MRAREESEWLMVAEIAKRLGRAHSTVSSWRDRFHDLIPARQPPRGRGLLHPLAHFELIRAMTDDRRDTGAIREALVGLSGRPAPAEQPDLATVLTELRSLRAVVDRIAERLGVVDAAQESP